MLSGESSWNLRAGAAIGVVAFLVFVAISAGGGVEPVDIVGSYTNAVVIGVVVAALAPTQDESGRSSNKPPTRGMPAALVVLLLVLPVRYGVLAFDIEGPWSGVRETTVDVFVRAGVAFALVYAGSIFMRR